MPIKIKISKEITRIHPLFMVLLCIASIVGCISVLYISMIYEMDLPTKIIAGLVIIMDIFLIHDVVTKDIR